MQVSRSRSKDMKYLWKVFSREKTKREHLVYINSFFFHLYYYSNVGDLHFMFSLFCSSSGLEHLGCNFCGTGVKNKGRRYMCLGAGASFVRVVFFPN